METKIKNNKEKKTVIIQQLLNPFLTKIEKNVPFVLLNR